MWDFNRIPDPVQHTPTDLNDSLALDFKFDHGLLNLISNLDKIIAHSGGRIYLTKDAVMSKEIFRECYPKWEEFEQIRRKYKAIGKFMSHQSLRLGLE